MNSTQNQTQFHWPILLFYFFFFLFKSFRWLLGSHNTLLSFPPSSSSHYRPFTFPLFNKEQNFQVEASFREKKNNPEFKFYSLFFFFLPSLFYIIVVSVLYLVCYGLYWAFCKFLLPRLSQGSWSWHSACKYAVSSLSFPLYLFF